MNKRAFPIALLAQLAVACEPEQARPTPTEVAIEASAAPSLEVAGETAPVDYLCPQGPLASRKVEPGAEGDFNGNGVICDLYAQRSPSRAGAVISMDDVPTLPAR
jgi:hypothetical protein